MQFYLPPSVQVPRGGWQHILQQSQAEGASDPETSEVTSILRGHQTSGKAKVCTFIKLKFSSTKFLDLEPGLFLRDASGDSQPHQRGRHPAGMKGGQGQKRRNQNPLNQLRLQPRSQSLSTFIRTRSAPRHRGLFRYPGRKRTL